MRILAYCTWSGSGYCENLQNLNTAEFSLCPRFHCRFHCPLQESVLSRRNEEAAKVAPRLKEGRKCLRRDDNKRRGGKHVAKRS